MERKEQISEVAWSILNNQCKASYLQLQRNFDTNKTNILAEFEQVILNLITATQQQQLLGEKRAIKYFAASFLLSSTITETWDFRLSLMDDQQFLDPVESCVYWSPSWIAPVLANDKNMLLSEMKKRIIRLHSYEIDPIWRAYVCGFYYALVGDFFARYLKNAAVKANFDILDTENVVEFIFGGFMDRTAQIDILAKDCDGI